MSRSTKGSDGKRQPRLNLMAQNTSTEHCVPRTIRRFPLEMLIEIWPMRSGQGPVDHISCSELASALDTPN